MRAALTCAVLLALLAHPAQAEAPAASIRPQPNPALVDRTAGTSEPSNPTATATLAPVSAPQTGADVAALANSPKASFAPVRSLRPHPRPDSDAAQTLVASLAPTKPAAPEKKTKASKKARSVVTRDIKGEVWPRSRAR